MPYPRSTLTDEEKRIRDRDATRRYRAKHGDRIRERTLETKRAWTNAWRAANPEKNREARARYREAHRDEIREKSRAYAAARRLTHPEKQREAKRKYLEAHGERLRAERRQKYRSDLESSREAYRDYARKRRAHKLGAPVVESVCREEIIALDNAICYLCGKRCMLSEIHLDHVIPLSRGGEHSTRNIRVACGPCNMSKGNRTPEEYRCLAS